MIVSISLSQIEKRQKIVFIFIFHLINYPSFVPKVTSCDIAKSFFFCIVVIIALKSPSSRGISLRFAKLSSEVRFYHLKKRIGVYHVSFLPAVVCSITYVMMMMKSRFLRFLTTILIQLHTSLIIIRESQLDRPEPPSSSS